MILFVFFRKVSVLILPEKGRWTPWFSLSNACLPVLAACAIFGGGSETLHRAKGYDIHVPDSWIQKNTGDESDQTFHTANGSIATITSSCQRNANASLDVLTRHLLLGARNTTFLKKERFLVSGREGQYSSIKTMLDGKIIYLEIFVLPKRACVFDFSLVNDSEIQEKEKREFVAFFKSFNYGND